MAEVTSGNVTVIVLDEDEADCLTQALTFLYLNDRDATFLPGLFSLADSLGVEIPYPTCPQCDRTDDCKCEIGLIG